MEYKIIPININLVKKDEQFLHIQHLIDIKRRMLLEKQKKIKIITKQNQFLDAVKNDYAKYYDHIYTQKKEQMDAFNLLNSYIHDLTISGQLSKNNIDDAKFEQERIVKELNKIRRGLDNIMDDTDEISLNLRKKNIL